MRCLNFVGSIAVAVAPLWAQAGPSQPTLPQHTPMIVHERHGTAVTSTNWSGYAVTGANGSVTDVTGSWTVPAIVNGTCGATTQYSSFWLGIDGYDSNTVEQIGTDSDCQNGKPVYYAWYEFYPHFSYTVGLAIAPGDLIDAEVQYIGGKFKVTLTDVTTGEAFSTTQKVSNAKRSSAEWIAEAPSGGGILPLADFGTVSFGANNDAAIGASTGAIGTFAATSHEITMDTSSGTVKAQPSPLDRKDMSSFTVTWVSAGP